MPSSVTRDKVLYIMPEYPSLSQTFVANEAFTVSALGFPVLGYALRLGAAERSAAPMDLICAPATPSQLIGPTIRQAPKALRDLARHRRHGLKPREAARWAVATVHAEHILDEARSAGVAHIHAHFLGRPADVACILARRLNCAWTATAHGTDVYAPPEPGLMGRRLQSVAAVACANRGLLERLQRLSDPGTVRVGIVHCGVDTRRLRFSPDRGSHATRHLVTVGRLVPTKGHWTIIEAAVTLMRADPELRWTVVGDGPLWEALTQDPRTRELAPRLHFAGALDHRAILALLEDATAFVLPCERGPDGRSDGIPVALMEAMAMGIPVVTSAVGGISELVIDQVTGFLVPEKSASALSQVVSTLMYRTPAPEIAAVREAGRSKVEREFNLRHEAQALVTMLRPYLASSA